jgi:hypothetical protein
MNLQAQKSKADDNCASTKKLFDTVLVLSVPVSLSAF